MNENKKAQKIEDKENAEAKRLRRVKSDLSFSDFDGVDKMSKFSGFYDQTTQSIIDEAKSKFAQAIATKSHLSEFKSFLNTQESSDMFNVLYKNQIHRNMSSILGGARNNCKQAFKDLYNTWFDEKKKTKYLRILEDNGVKLSNICKIEQELKVNKLLRIFIIFGLMRKERKQNIYKL